MNRTGLVLLLVALGAVCPGWAQTPGPGSTLAKTPPMGWNSWNKFAAKIDDATIRAQADAMVSSGMKAAGYGYINIDEGWEGTRDAQGTLAPNKGFPDMNALAAYVHGKGLKIGNYSSPGPEGVWWFRRKLRARGAGCKDVCILGYGLPEI